MWYWAFLILLAIPPAYGQTIQVNQTAPCFEDYDNYTNILQNCGFEQDWLKASLTGFEYITGGYFSFLLVGVIVLGVYLKYQKWIYPLIIGIAFIPYAWFLVPEIFVNYLIIFAVVGGGIAAWKFFKHNLSEY